MQNTAQQYETGSRLRHFARAFLLLSAWLSSSALQADDWMTWPSTYTHEPTQGQRVDQFAPPVQPVSQRDASFQRSGYRHYRSTLQGGNSSDNMHIVEQWGAPVVPYEQWRFPFRPYGSPYDAWGPQAPYGIINGNFGGGPGYPGGFNQPPGMQPNPTQPNQMQPNPMRPNPMQPGFAGPYDGYSNQGYPNPGYSPQVPSNGFPLSPPYQNQPWYDGNYPVAPPLDNRSDAEFFYKPQRQ